MVKMTSCGFERFPEGDFSDDGNRFTCYLYHDVKISYLHKYDEYYISAHHASDLTNLTYKEYSKLPSYPKLDSLNGIDVLTVKDLEELKEGIDSFLAEAKEFEKTIPEITDDEITKLYLDLYNEKLAAFNEIKARGVEIDDLAKLNSYDLGNFISYYLNIKKDVDNTRAQGEKCCSLSQFQRRYKKESIIYDMKKLAERDNFYYKQCMHYIDKIKY